MLNSAYFYPRSPCGERLVNGDVPLSCFGNFYPRSPCGERPAMGKPTLEIAYFYPRSPCGERLIDLVDSPVAKEFLSTLSLRRATSAPNKNDGGPGDFYPRSPCGERLKLFAKRLGDALISIHALLAESDKQKGETQQNGQKFLSTLSLRRATQCKL